MTPIAETTTPFESLPPVVASPPLQQPTGVELPALPQFELPALLQFPGGVLNMQPPTVDESPTQLCDAFMPTAARADVYELHEHDEEDVLLSSWRLKQLALLVSSVAIPTTIQTTIAIA